MATILQSTKTQIVNKRVCTIICESFRQLRSALTGTDLVDIELTVVDFRWTRERVVVSPVGARLRLLVEQSTRRTKESEVSDAAASHLYANVECFAARFYVCVVCAEDAAFTVETCCSPCGCEITWSQNGNRLMISESKCCK